MSRKRNRLSRTRDNERLLKRQGYFRLKKEFLSVASKEKVTIETATAEDIKRVREKLIQQKKRNMTIKIIAISISILIGLLVFVLLGKSLNLFFFQ